MTPLYDTQAEIKSQEFELEMKSSQQEVDVANEAVSVAEEALNAAVEEEESLVIKVGELKALWEEAKAELDEIEKSLKTCSQELSILTNEKSKLVKKAESAELDAKKMSVKIAKYHAEKAKAEKYLSNMLKKHAWIETEKAAFGVTGGDYDFEKTNPDEMSKHLRELQAEQSSLVRKLMFSVITALIDSFDTSLTFDSIYRRKKSIRRSWV